MNPLPACLDPSAPVRAVAPFESIGVRQGCARTQRLASVACRVVRSPPAPRWRWPGLHGRAGGHGRGLRRRVAAATTPTALREFQPAAEKGDRDAQLALADMYLRGYGVAADPAHRGALVPQGGRPGRSARADQSRLPVRAGQGRRARLRGGREVVSQGGRPGRADRAEQPVVHGADRPRRAAGRHAGRALGHAGRAARPGGGAVPAGRLLHERPGGRARRRRRAALVPGRRRPGRRAGAERARLGLQRRPRRAARPGDGAALAAACRPSQGDPTAEHNLGHGRAQRPRRAARSGRRRALDPQGRGGRLRARAGQPGPDVRRRRRRDRRREAGRRVVPEGRGARQRVGPEQPGLDAHQRPGRRARRRRRAAPVPARRAQGQRLRDGQPRLDGRGRPRPAGRRGRGAALVPPRRGARQRAGPQPPRAAVCARQGRHARRRRGRSAASAPRRRRASRRRATTWATWWPTASAACRGPTSPPASRCKASPARPRRPAPRNCPRSIRRACRPAERARSQQMLAAFRSNAQRAGRARRRSPGRPA